MQHFNGPNGTSKKHCFDVYTSFCKVTCELWNGIIKWKNESNAIIHTGKLKISVSMLYCSAFLCMKLMNFSIFFI